MCLDAVVFDDAREGAADDVVCVAGAERCEREARCFACEEREGRGRGTARLLALAHAAGAATVFRS